MSRTGVNVAAGLAVADVIHTRLPALPVSATVGDVRAWIAASSHRRMAFLADNGRYVGSLTPADLAGDVDTTCLASEIALHGPTITPDAPASAGYELAVLTPARRVPVVDRDDTLLGVVAVTEDLAAFCGTA